MQRRTYIDGNSVGHAAQHGHGKNGKKLVAGGVETTAIYGTMTSMHKLLRARLAATPIILWDGRSWRYDRHEDYKGNRTDTAEKQAERQRYRDQRKAMARGLHLLGLSQLIAGNMEADDLAAILVRKEIAAGNMVTLITGDKDWLQLVQKGVAWLEHKPPHRKCSVDTFQDFTGYRTPKAFVHAKALQGDTGDNIKPNTGIGEKGALDLLSVFDDVHSFQQLPEDEVKARYLAKFAKGIPAKYMKLRTCPDVQARFEFALELMDLAHPSIPAPTGIKGTKAKVDRPGFEKFCAEFAFHSLLRDMDNFLKPFIALEEEFGK